MTLRHPRRAVALLLATLALCAPLPAAAELTPPPQPLIGERPMVAGWPDEPSVGAPVVLLVEAATGQVLVARQADHRRPVASTIKILTALTVADRTDPDDIIEVGAEVQGLEGASVQLEPGERWTVDQMLTAILVRSGNDAAEALAVAVGDDRAGFLELMREDAASMGLPVGEAGGVVVTSPSGLGDGELLSAQDLATLARVLLADDDLRAIVGAREATLPGVGTDVNRNLLVGSYPGATGIKTGFTEAAGNSVVASAARGGRELIAVVLGAGPDPQRFEDAAALLDHGFEAFEATEVAAELILLVAGGQRQVVLEPTPVTVPVGVPVAAELPVPVRTPEAGHLPVPVRFDGTEVATATATVSGEQPPAVAGGAQLGRAAVDGVYAALRAAHAQAASP
ncbi:D-alanyl-D-alanine carboxypeptidase family protein [Nitriliruptor alkaliphilus]|uniref:D-alanyl-D-alanine carboxypeptidase family protein n=1 Tax=Nitriliruptor alkaliphilus TaxID=427918 RepID=UPI0006987429|nr:serine hydrolase [Nitriliruptor alkaliphilus]